MREQITVRLDQVSAAALHVLISDGTSVTVAVRAAITDAAERYPEPDEAARQQPHDGETVSEWLARNITAAPPLGDYQRYVLIAAFIEKRKTWLSEAEWLARRR